MDHRVTVQDKQYNCLLDTEPQSTIVTKWFYDQYSSEQQIEPRRDLLKVGGASGQSVPSLRYVEVINHLPKTLEVNTKSQDYPWLFQMVERQDTMFWLEQTDTI